MTTYVGASSCAPQSQPVSPIAPPSSTSASGAGTSTTAAVGGSNSDWVIIVAIVVPVVIVVGLVVAVSIYIIHRRGVVSSTKMLAELAKQDSLADLKRSRTEVNPN